MSDLSPWQRDALYRLHLAASPHPAAALVGIGRDSADILGSLAAKGLAVEVESSRPFPLWQITDAGRAEAARRWPDVASAEGTCA